MRYFKGLRQHIFDRPENHAPKKWLRQNQDQPPDATFEVSVEVVGDHAALTPEQIAGVEKARRSLEFASEQEINAVYA